MPGLQGTGTSASGADHPQQSYSWSGAVDVGRPYAVNPLNQYTSAGSGSAAKTFSYDANGNLTSSGTTAYVYDVENRPVAASGGHIANLRYDPLGRLYEVGAATPSRRLLWDPGSGSGAGGDALVAEYTTANALAARFVHGASEGVDDPLIWFGGGENRRLHTDHQGSVVAITNGAGAQTWLNAYDEWGIPNMNAGVPANTGRFQYTGQIWIGELGMYHYKARIYSPTLGRFLQTDPIGYEGGINLYAYVSNDPVNLTDPDGQHESHWLLRLIVPGQIAWDNAVTAAENGDWGTGAANLGRMVAEQVLTVATLGQGGLAVQGTRSVAPTARVAAAGSRTGARAGERVVQRTSSRAARAISLVRSGDLRNLKMPQGMAVGWPATIAGSRWQASGASAVCPLPQTKRRYTTIRRSAKAGEDTADRKSYVRVVISIGTAMMTPEPAVSLQFILNVEEGWPPVGSESLPFLKSGEVYEALLPPLFVKGLSVGDSIEVTLDERGFVRRWRHVMKSGHSVIWILRMKSCEGLDAVLEEVRSLGCNTVGHDDLGCYAIDIPQNVDIDEVERTLEALDRQGFAVAFPSLRHS